MDTGEYETNTLLINNITSIVYRVYEPLPEKAHSFPAVAADVEASLRSKQHVVHYDPARRAIWHFQVMSQDGTSESKADPTILGDSVEASGFTLTLVEDGMFEPMSLFRSRFQGPHLANTPTSSSSSGSVTDAATRGAHSLATGPLASTQPLDSSGAAIPSLPLESKGVSTGTRKDAYEVFVHAVLASLSSRFCEKFNALPINSRTMLLPYNRTLTNGSDEVVIPGIPTTATFDVRLTTTGTLILSISVTYSRGLRSIDTAPSSAPVLSRSQVVVAPLGILVDYVGPQDSHELEPGSSHTPDTQALRQHPDTLASTSKWRQSCTKRLQLRGIPGALLSRCNWVSVRMPWRRAGDRRPDDRRMPHVDSSALTVSWPSCLCFAKSPVLGPANLHGDTMLISKNGPVDILQEAQTWYLADAARLGSRAERKKEREAAVSRDPPEAEPRPQKTAEQSPLAFRRTSNTATAVASAMYPTPPDGVQQQTGVTPSMDGTVSSPGNQPPTVAVVDVDATMANTAAVPETDVDVWGSGETKRERADEGFLSQSGDLFGDMSGDMFGEADITDADFSFFDEQPGDVQLDLTALPDLNDSMSNLDTSPKASTDVPKMTDHAVKVESDHPIFAKPELRHARSSLVDDKQQKGEVEKPSSIKRQPSPFNAEAVYKRVRASLSQPKASSNGLRGPSARKGSIFDKVDFDPLLPQVNSKYEHGGRYDFSWKPHFDSTNAAAGLPPTTDYLRRHSRQNRRKRTLKDLPGNTLTLLSKITGGLENSSIHDSPAKISDVASDPDDGSVVSDEDDSSYTSDDPLSPVKSSVRRTKLEDDATSQSTSPKELEWLEELDPAVALELPRSRLEHPELPVTKYFADPEPMAMNSTFRDDDFITVAQILTEQAASGLLRIPGGSSDRVALALGDSHRSLASTTRFSVAALQDIVPTSLGQPTPCSFREFIEVQDAPLIAQPNRMQPRPVPHRDPNAELLKAMSIYQIPAPHFEVRRQDSKLSVLPSAIAFWESLGLGPCQGAKDINAVCVFPDGDGMCDDVDAFLDRFRSVYDSLKLGEFERVATSTPTCPTNGLLPYYMDNLSTFRTSLNSALSPVLAEQMENLTQTLSGLDVTEKNFVIFFVYVPGRAGSIVEACSTFQQLFESYKKALGDRKKSPANDIVLQLISMDFLSSPVSLAIPSLSEMNELALETYDRCTLFGGQMPSPAIALEQNLPRLIDFKLTPSPSASLMHENSCIHLAYAQSVDGRWVTAAWTDNRGVQQMTASYCLGRRGRPLMTLLSEVAAEMWMTTRDLISVWKVHWRVIITKCGPMDQQEMESWMAQAQREPPGSVSLTLLTVDTNPSLQLIPPTTKIPMSATNAFYSTPVSTPQASMVSPDPMGTPATPVRESAQGNPTTPGGGDNAAEADNDSILVDTAELTWGAILSHRLNNSPSPTEVNPALVSGYLVKRGGCRVEDAPVIMEVNLVHFDGNPRTTSRVYEALLREMLSNFSGLATLARARRVVQRDADVRPWHIAAAEKGVRAMYLLM